LPAAFYFARPLNPVESISIFQTPPRPATYLAGNYSVIGKLILSARWLR